MTAEQKPKVEEVLERMRGEIKELRKHHKKVKKDLATKNDFADMLKKGSPKESKKETYTSEEKEENIEL